MPRRVGYQLTRPGRRADDPDVELPIAQDIRSVPGIPRRDGEISYYSREYPLESVAVETKRSTKSISMHAIRKAEHQFHIRQAALFLRRTDVVAHRERDLLHAPGFKLDRQGRGARDVLVIAEHRAIDSKELVFVFYGARITEFRQRGVMALTDGDQLITRLVLNGIRRGKECPA